MALSTQPATKAQIEAAARAIISGAGIQDGPLRGLSMEDFDRATDLSNKITASGYTGMEDDFENEEQNAVMPIEGMDLQGLAATNPALTPFMSRYFASMDAERGSLQQQAANREKQFKDAEAAIREKRFGAPTTSEQLFALGAALLSPRRYRGFAGTLDNIVPVFGQMEKAQRSADTQREDVLEKLRREYLMGQDESAVAAARAEREALGKVLPSVVSATKPRVPRMGGTTVIDGKVVVTMQDDEGMPYTVAVGDAPADMIPVPGVTSQGQPVFRSGRGITTATGEPVTQFDPKETKPRAPSTTEMREIFKTEDDINSASDAIYTLQKARDLNAQALEGSLSGFRKTLGQMFSSDDPQYVATEEFDKLQITAAMQKLKSTFGGNISDGERKALVDLEAVSKYPRAARARIIQNGLDAVQRILARETRRLEDLKTGQYSQYKPPAAAPATGKPRVIRYDKKGNRI